MLMSHAAYCRRHNKPATGPRGAATWALRKFYCYCSLLLTTTGLAAFSLPALPLLPAAALLQLCRWPLRLLCLRRRLGLLALLPGPGVPSVELASVVRCRRLLGVRLRVRLDPMTPEIMVVYVLGN